MTVRKSPNGKAIARWRRASPPKLRRSRSHRNPRNSARFLHFPRLFPPSAHLDETAFVVTFESWDVRRLERKRRIDLFASPSVPNTIISRLIYRQEVFLDGSAVEWFYSK